jgi:DNA repair protein RadD
MAKAIDKKDLNYKIVDEIIRKAGDRKAWLIFCVGIDHARHIADILIEYGINAAYVTGKTPKDERDSIISDFRAGYIRALINANVLSTGFDYPDIDLIAMLRPTKSKALYIQQAGRGMRLKSHTDHCLVLDFAGNVRRHGPITAIGIDENHGLSGGYPGEGGGGEMVKECPSCYEILPRNTIECPECGHEFLKLRNDDIMGNDIITMDVKSWRWSIHESRTSGMLMMKCKYYGKNISDEPIAEYFPVLHDEKPDFRDKKTKIIQMMARACGVEIGNRGDFEFEYDYLCDIQDKMNSVQPPQKIEYKMKGRFANVKSRIW